MGFKFDGKKVKADMSSALGYAQKSGTKFMNAAGAGVATAKSMGAKNTAKAAAGGAINAFGKTMKLINSTGPLGVGVILGFSAADMVQNIKKKRAKK